MDSGIKTDWENRNGLPWSERDDAILMAMLRDGYDLEDIAARLLRSVESITTRRRRSAAARQGEWRRWTADEDAVVRRLYASEQPSAIGQILGRSSNSVIGRASRLGVSAARRSPGGDADASRKV